MTFGRNIQNTLEQSLHVSIFLYVCLFINFSSFKPDTEKNMCIIAIIIIITATIIPTITASDSVQCKHTVWRWCWCHVV